MDTRTEARTEAAKHLRARGLTYRKIGAAIGVSHSTARRYAPGPRGGGGETPHTPPGVSGNGATLDSGGPECSKTPETVGEGVTPPPTPCDRPVLAVPSTALADWIEGLALPDTGETFALMPWERDFCKLLESESGDVALSVARGNGKTALVAAIATAAVHPEGPLHRRRALTVIVAHDFKQAGIAFGDVRDMLFPDGQPGKAWRMQDSSNARRIEHRPTGAAVEVISSNPRRAHGLRPLLVLADEPAQWEDGISGAMVAALKTSLGKMPGSRMIALGTRPATPDHWFERMLEEGPALVYAAAPDADPTDEANWTAANPSLEWMPHLRDRIALEAADTGEPSALARFRALRLNAGVADTAAAVLISAEAWARVESADPAPREGRPIWGVDLGGSAASSAIAAVWRTGRVEVFAAFPAGKPLAERGRTDNVGSRYGELAARGELVTLGGHGMDYGALMRTARERFGAPFGMVADRWRQAELADANRAAGVRVRFLDGRGMGFKDGGEDVRLFERAVLEEKISVVPSRLARDALYEARCITDPAGNRKVAKGSEGGRRSRARDDAAVAIVLAVSWYMRNYNFGWRKGLPPVRLIPV